MKKSFSLSEIQKTGNLKADLIRRQFRLDQMAKVIKVKSVNPKLKQSEIAREFKTSSSTLQQYREDAFTLYNTKHSHNKTKVIQPWSQNDLKWPQKDLKELKMISNDLKKT